MVGLSRRGLAAKSRLEDRSHLGISVAGRKMQGLLDRQVHHEVNVLLNGIKFESIDGEEQVYSAIQDITDMYKKELELNRRNLKRRKPVWQSPNF